MKGAFLKTIIVLLILMAMLTNPSNKSKSFQVTPSQKLKAVPDGFSIPVNKRVSIEKIKDAGNQYTLNNLKDSPSVGSRQLFII